MFDVDLHSPPLNTSRLSRFKFWIRFSGNTRNRVRPIATDGRGYEDVRLEPVPALDLPLAGAASARAERDWFESTRTCTEKAFIHRMVQSFRPCRDWEVYPRNPRPHLPRRGSSGQPLSIAQDHGHLCPSPSWTSYSYIVFLFCVNSVECMNGTLYSWWMAALAGSRPGR